MILRSMPKENRMRLVLFFCFGKKGRFGECDCYTKGQVLNKKKESPAIYAKPSFPLKIECCYETTFKPHAFALV